MKWCGNAASLLRSPTFKSVTQEMGRRVGDVMTPVPVLGVPALVGVCGLKTTGEDTAAGVLLHTWGLHCSVGVQTSPGISRQPTQQPSTDTLPVLSERNNQIFNKETHYEDNDKRAILKQKSGESKTKKEVTFKALGGETSHNVTCIQRNRNGTYCFARAIKTNPHFADNITNVRPKLKPAVRYTNGSVVDSEAIGGISVDGNEAAPIKSGTFRERDPVRKQGHHAEHCGRTPLSSVARPFGTVQKLCSLCGGRQSVTTRAATLGANNPAVSASSLNSALAALSTGTHFHTSHIERNRDIKPNQDQITDSVTDRDNGTQTLHVNNEEARFRKTAHPACPVHAQSGHNLISLSHTRTAGDQTSNQLANIPHAKTVTITQATIETKQDTNVQSFAEPTQDNNIPRPTSLTLTPQTAAATKHKDPQSHTHPTVPRTGTVPAITRPHNATKTNTHKKTVSFNSAHVSTKVPPPRMHKVQKVHPTNATQVDAATNACLQISKKKCPDSKITSASDSTLRHLGIVAAESSLNKRAASDRATRQIHLIKTNSEPLIHESTTKSQQSRLGSTSGVTTSSTSACHSTQSASLKKSSVSLKEVPSTVSLSSCVWTENQSNEVRHIETPRTNKPSHNDQSVVCTVSNQENDSKTNPLTLSRLLTVSKKHSRDTDASTNNPELIMNISTRLHTDKNKLSENVSNEFVAHESKQHENSKPSQVAELQNIISLIKSSSHVNTEQHYQGCTKKEHEGHCDPSPLVHTAQETDAKTELFALAASSKHTHIEAESSADNPPHYSYSTISTAQTNFMSSSAANSKGQVDHVTQIRVHRHSDSRSKLSFTAPVPFKNHGGPECNSITPPSTLQPVTPPCLRSSEMESTLSPALTQLCPVDSSLTRSHPTDAATLLPLSSSQCWRPAILQQELETVEASLAANKDRITTLLNIIHDLETCHTPTIGDASKLDRTSKPAQPARRPLV
ncbi:hypothetical protein JOB18_001630 [Solea senegalensis]|uniref:Uncharacterized protein n=1 Tax=Solea senegalensis TaxID=28829 RepID=A0AAV6SED5_SOLSE|nr:uncharacterized protein LOC122779637 isoform X2 [Solea senegalensis]KAG7515189.1 hypothetical protein JOB18_001630 [Solea senegalensis]KAG7515190.1 hypothetical protein JOB18_001630 [Solea senegalensis]